MRKLSNLFLTLAMTSAAALFAETQAPGDFTSRITWQTLGQFAFSNAPEVQKPVRGIVVFHHGLGCAAFDANLKGWEEDYARHGLVALHPHASPWGWMNEVSLRMTRPPVSFAVVSRHASWADAETAPSSKASMNTFPFIAYGKGISGS